MSDNSDSHMSSPTPSSPSTPDLTATDAPALSLDTPLPTPLPNLANTPAALLTPQNSVLGDMPITPGEGPTGAAANAGAGAGHGGKKGKMGGRKMKNLASETVGGALGQLWQNKQFQSEYTAACEAVLDKEFNLKQFGDPYDERDMFQKPAGN
ncbi:hypothetical protein BJ508DRAFT_365695 [Ascobolus immersus RN42]|uniref:Uncharacterized protein n=1 Tax=Ascobolus immersus RN42 TaxID=1160509 RepID=A0A3N4HNV3_ASCIM|nr:hypothetical protein BJ508DRAFT_365695 [Ascobolus immersus RN42]